MNFMDPNKNVQGKNQNSNQKINVEQVSISHKAKIYFKTYIFTR